NDPHSPDSIRVNGLVSQMPEFSRAFGCKAGDAHFVEPDRVCYLFGEKSTGQKVNTVNISENSADADVDYSESPVLEENNVDVSEVEGSGDYGQANEDPEPLTNE
ncbi:hypothetical protein PENTCL1PPCAC_21660, partial [Pristionchus entomophagus]